MVIGYFDVIRVAIDKTETDSPLFIDGYGMLSLSGAVKRMQSIAGGHPEVV